jgi:hypothetical protein
MTLLAFTSASKWLIPPLRAFYLHSYTHLSCIRFRITAALSRLGQRVIEFHRTATHLGGNTSVEGSSGSVGGFAPAASTVQPAVVNAVNREVRDM